MFDKYEAYKASNNGKWVEPRKRYEEIRSRFPYIAIVDPLRDCDALIWLITNETYTFVDTDRVDGFDYLIIPYKGYIDIAVERGISIGAEIIDLETATKTMHGIDAADFKCGKDNTSINDYLKNIDYGNMLKYDNNAIKMFRDEYFFLSNFYESPVMFEGLTFRNSESAFQAQKCVKQEEKEKFINLNGKAAKYLGKRVELRSDWELVKEDIMYAICFCKFSQNMELKNKLLETGDSLLVEGNDWNDRFWGVCKGKGKNKLGKILMKVRNELRTF